MRRDLAALASPSDDDIPTFGPDDGEEPKWLKARKKLIKTQPGWWRTLPEYDVGMAAYVHLRDAGFTLMVLTKGPYQSTQAWTEKVEWCREHLPEAQVTITEDKGLVYGKVLVDDWPAYGIRWLQWRPRGLLIVPAWPWNTLDKYPEHLHPNILRLKGGDWPNELPMLMDRIETIKKNIR
jgi:hypothetical protein